MNNSIATGISNAVSYICLTVLVNGDEILEWIYTLTFAVSVIFSIVYPIVSATKDKKITKKEYDKIQKSLEEAQARIKDFEAKEHKEDK